MRDDSTTLTDERKAELRDEYGEDGPAKARFLSLVEQVAGADALPSSISEFMRKEDLETHRALAEFHQKVAEHDGNIKDALRTMREEQGIPRASSEGSDDLIRQTERANADLPADDSAVVDRIKQTPDAAIHASPDALARACKELQADNRVDEARQLLFDHGHRFSQERRNSILGSGDPSDELRPNAAVERWNERNPKDPNEDPAEARRRANAERDPTAEGVTSTLETMPGSYQDRAAEERKREEYDRRQRRENAAEGDEVNLDLGTFGSTRTLPGAPGGPLRGRGRLTVAGR